MIMNIIKILATIGILICGVWLLVLVIDSTYTDYKEYKTYSEFCDNHDICYCEDAAIGICEFKTSEQCINGICEKSNETKELCNLATKLNDKSLMFRAC
jgi:hypothetical protein